LVVLSFGSLLVSAQVDQGFGNQNTQYNPDVPGAESLQGGKLIEVIKSFINWMLGILALIALVILLWGGFQMVTAAGDDAKYKKGFKILQQAAIGLVFIGVSWLVVSVIFWLL
jgi:hypothetical protein